MTNKMTLATKALEDCCEPQWREDVAKAFGHAAPTYDAHAILQRDTLPTLMEALQDCLQDCLKGSQVNTAMDLGTGTGATALAVANMLAQSSPLNALDERVVYLNDCSEVMLRVAEKKLGQHFPALPSVLQRDAAESLLFPHGGVDLITAHWVLQWIPDWQAALNHWWQYTQCLAFTVPLHTSFAEWHAASEGVGVASTLNSKHYPTLEALTHYCQELHPEQLIIKEAIMTQNFASGHDFLRSLKAIGAHTPFPKATSSSLRPVLRATSGGFSVTTHVAWVVMARAPVDSTESRTM